MSEQFEVDWEGVTIEVLCYPDGRVEAVSPITGDSIVVENEGILDDAVKLIWQVIFDQARERGWMNTGGDGKSDEHAGGQR